MSTEITTTNDAVVEKQTWARAMAPSGLLPKAYQGNPANLFLAAEYADALGIERINALTAIYVVEGKPTLSADLMVALARRAGHKVRVQVKADAAKATLIRADDPDFEYEVIWTLDRAQKAGLAGKAVWKNYPQAMLRARATAEVIRQGASEVLMGAVYTPEELNAVGPDGVPNITTAAPRVTVDEIIGAPDLDPVIDITDAEVIVEDEPEWSMADEGDPNFPADTKAGA